MEKIAYEVGALMYSPAINDKISDMIATENIILGTLWLFV